MDDGYRYMYIGFLKNEINHINKGYGHLELADSLKSIAWQVEEEWKYEIMSFTDMAWGFA